MKNGKTQIRFELKSIINEIIYKLKDNWWYVVVFIFIFYGLIILYKGISSGVYLTDSQSILYYLTKFVCWWQDKILITKSTDSYTISFFASAEQDYWFFLIIGLAVSIPSIRSPKTDGIRTKVSHFFPTLSESSPHMEEILIMMNKASCVAKVFHREMVITEIEGDIFKAIINTKFTLKNLHHNHSLDHNIGNFKITPDEMVKKTHPTWGNLIKFSDDKGNDICTPNKMVGDEFSVSNYNITLDANEEREYNCNYTIWFDKNELLSVSFIRFTESSSFEVVNQASKKIKITLKIVRNGIESNTIEETSLSEKESVSTDSDIKNLSDSDKVIIVVNY